jgi:DNA-directed RNA polymerase subunit H (RpoH/RPB5)
MEKKICSACPLDDASDALFRMLHHRGTAWEPMVAAAAELPARLTALVSPHARADHAHQCFLRAEEGGTRLIVLSDLEKLPTVAVKQAADPAFLAVHGFTAGMQVIAVSPPNAQTVRTLPPTVSLLAWHLILTYPLDHEIVPPQRRATTDDLAAAGLARCKRTALPSVRSDDPVVRYLDLAPGDVLRVDRRDGTLYFRRVVG